MFEGSTSLKVYTYTGQQRYSKNANVLACVFQMRLEVTFLAIFFDQKTTVHAAATVTGQKTCAFSFPYQIYLLRVFIEK